MLLSLLLIIQVLAHSAHVVRAAPFHQFASPADAHLKQTSREEIVARAALNNKIPGPVRRAQASTASYSTCTGCTIVEPVIVENYDISIDPTINVNGSNDVVDVSINPTIGVNTANQVDVTIAIGNSEAYSVQTIGQNNTQEGGSPVASNGGTVTSKRTGGPRRSRSFSGPLEASNHPIVGIDTANAVDVPAAVFESETTGIQTIGQAAWQEGSGPISSNLGSVKY